MEMGKETPWWWCSSICQWQSIWQSIDFPRLMLDFVANAALFIGNIDIKLNHARQVIAA